MGFLVSDEFVCKKDIYIIKKDNENINLKYLLAIINSKLISYLKTKGSTAATKDDFSQLTLNDLRKIPMKNLDLSSQNEFEKPIDFIVISNNEFNKIQRRFLNRIQSNFELDKPSKKIQSFYEYDFKTFLSELKKRKIKLSLSQQDEWEDYFNDYKAQLTELQNQINQTDTEIDQMVYQLYGLTDEEIKIVEGSIS